MMTETMTLSPKDILVEAKNILNTEGWIQFTYHDGKGYCMLGAMYKAVGAEYNAHGIPVYSREQADAVEKAAKNFKGIAGEEGWPPFFNDANGRTKQEVLDAFDLAAQNAAS